MSRKALGRGLSALIPSLHSSEKSEVIEVSIEQLKPNPYQPRMNVDEKTIDELAESIKKHGVLQPIIVREKEGYYEIIAGERRYLAAKKAGLSKIPSIIKNLEDSECALVALVENLQRENLNPLEEATAYKKLQDTFGFTQEKMAEMLGISRSAIANTMRLLSLPDEIKNHIQSGKLTRGHAIAISGLPEPELQLEAAKTIIKNGLSVRETEKLVNLLKAQKSGGSKVKDKVSQSFKALAREFAKKLGLKTKIRLKKSKIEIVIQASNIEEVEETLRKIHA